jgi:hypothetical protein
MVFDIDTEKLAHDAALLQKQKEFREQEKRKQTAAKYARHLDICRERNKRYQVKQLNKGLYKLGVKVPTTLEQEYRNKVNELRIGYGFPRATTSKKPAKAAGVSKSVTCYVPIQEVETLKLFAQELRQQAGLGTRASVMGVEHPVQRRTFRIPPEHEQEFRDTYADLTGKQRKPVGPKLKEILPRGQYRQVALLVHNEFVAILRAKEKDLQRRSDYVVTEADILDML